MMKSHSPLGEIWEQYSKRPVGLFALGVFAIFVLMGVYAPFLASSKPFFLIYDGTLYFPLFRYLFYTGFYTKYLDIFYNLLIFTLPVLVLTVRRPKLFLFALCAHLGAFFWIIWTPADDPAGDVLLNRGRQEAIQSGKAMTWQDELEYMTPYAKLNLLLRQSQRKDQHMRLQRYAGAYEAQKQKTWEMSNPGVALPESFPLPTLWQQEEAHRMREIQESRRELAKNPSKQVQEALDYELHRMRWLEAEGAKISYLLSPLIRSFHWEDDAGGEQSLNQYVPWWELTRINRKDLVAGLIFGIRISLVVGISSVLLALLIGVPVGAFAGYFGGGADIVVSRLMEIWESMPSFFMLLMVVAVTESKSVFLVIAVIGVFGWTGFSRYIRAEVLKQRNLAYVKACSAMGFSHRRIIFSHVLPNAIFPLLTLLPFSIMGAISAEAGLSFLGLGEEGSCSWGVLMDEGRNAFPGESYLLWPPALSLTILLVAVALIGDCLRDALDPKMRD